MMDTAFHIIIMILHVLGATLIVGASFASLIILLPSQLKSADVKLLNRIWKIISPLIGLQILTGIILAAGEWSEFGSSWLFWLKLVLLVIDGLFFGRVASQKVAQLVASGEKTIPNNLSKLAWVSFIIFITITTLGVLLVETV